MKPSLTVETLHEMAAQLSAIADNMTALVGMGEAPDKMARLGFITFMTMVNNDILHIGGAQ